ncbi:MAG: Myo-inositol-1-phosphate synthase [Candidatus Methanoperedenaceae archaeon GB50]|nr:Myo-inositol-1-phosphate synthase [Candidatus Methanoperedenaceae archaeon GB50]CAD7782723.1 MAG: Myo-inositol-1-phosphate synthase [Candidatus Methanoperedenaceae archaeon GB50]
MKAEKIRKGNNILPAKGRLGVLLPGLAGAVSSTFIAGVEAVRRGMALPIGSLTQMGTIRLGKRTEKRIPKIKEFINLANLEDLVFGGWDIYEDNLYEACLKAKVLEKNLVEDLKDFLSSIKPYPAVFKQEFVHNLQAKYFKKETNYLDLIAALKADIEDFKRKNKLERCVMVWCGSTEAYITPQEVHQSLEKFEEALKKNDPNISPSMLYAYAAIDSGISFVNGAPNLTVDIPALVEMAENREVPIAGKDFKTGQTLLKTIIAPGIKARLLGLKGWFSTNILGNRDGLVLDDEASYKTKRVSKLSVLEYILQPHVYPELYKDVYHKVRINYYPPRGDNKEAWDCIDIFGWLGYEMQIKVNFLCRDSILAAPVVLDLALFSDFAQRAGLYGVQEWLSFYFKSPMCKEELYPEHDLFIQLMKLKNTLRFLMEEEQITHWGLDYYME